MITPSISRISLTGQPQHYQNMDSTISTDQPVSSSELLNCQEIWFYAVHCLPPNPLCSDNPELSPLYNLNIDLLFYKNNKLSLYTLTPFLDHLVYFIFFWLCSDYIFLTVFDKLSKNWEEQQPNQATEEDVKKQVIEKETQMMYKQIWENVQLHLN